LRRKYGFPLADEWIQEQLSDGSAHKSMFQTGMALYAEMQNAIDLDGIRDSLSSKTAGAFGGLVKTWKAGLVASITKDIIRKLEMDVSRERIRGMQFDIFGRAQASRDLHEYAVKIRNGGGRAAPMPEVPEDLKDAAYQYFLDHQDDLKLRVQQKMSRPG